jgi:hypothetical protein
MGGKINNLERFPYFQGADLNKDAFFCERFLEYLLPKGTVHTNLVLINPYLGYFLRAENPRFSPPMRLYFLQEKPRDGGLLWEFNVTLCSNIATVLGLYSCNSRK